MFRFFSKGMFKLRKAKKDGLKTGNNFSILGTVDFGSEPYLITIGNNVRITDGVKFITHDGGVHVLRIENPDIDVIGPIVIGDNVFVGMNSIILPNITIGSNVVIGAGSVVTKNIPSNVVVAGVPARIIKTFDEYRTSSFAKGLQTKRLKKMEKKKFLLERFGE